MIINNGAAATTFDLLSKPLFFTSLPAISIHYSDSPFIPSSETMVVNALIVGIPSSIKMILMWAYHCYLFFYNISSSKYIEWKELLGFHIITY